MSHAIAPTPITDVSHFLESAQNQHAIWQLVDGEPQAINPPSRTHGTIHNELGLLLANHLAVATPHCIVMMTPGVVPQVNATENYRIPDIAVTCSPYTEETWVIDSPIVLAEVLSGSNRAQTWMNVWAFTTIASVEEIAVIHTDAIKVSLFRRQPDRTWPADPLTIGADGILVFESLGFHTPVRALYRNTLLDETG